MAAGRAGEHRVKFAFIASRYGADVTSGADHACRLLAEQISARHDVEVLTTCARDSRSWKNEYSEGVDRVRGALVRRFAVTQTHDPHSFKQFSERLYSSPGVRADELEWVRRCGPWSPGLIDHLKRQHRSYDALIFFSLCTPLTVHGVPIAPDHSLLFPYLQLTPALRFGLFAELLASVRAIGFVSSAERRLLRAYLRITPQNEEVVGIGIDPSPEQSYPRHQQNPADTVTSEDALASDLDAPEDASYLAGRGVPFRRRHRLYGQFALYGGRVEPDNGCEEMLEYFDTFAGTDSSAGASAKADGDTALVLMGVKLMKVPEEPYFRLAGVLPERERMIAYEAADVTIAPGSTDLVAQSVLESMAVGTPVLASALNESAVDHCRRANAGLYYRNREEFVSSLRLLMTSKRLRERLGENGRSYVRQHFRWEGVLGRFDRLVARIRTRA
jgi:glycosyltransferase involved in cell wall biosynthesis